MDPADGAPPFSPPPPLYSALMAARPPSQPMPLSLPTAAPAPPSPRSPGGAGTPSISSFMAAVQRMSEMSQRLAQLQDERDASVREAQLLRADFERARQAELRANARLDALTAEHARCPHEVAAAHEGARARESQLSRNAEASLVVVSALQRQLAETRDESARSLGEARVEVSALRGQVSDLLGAMVDLRQQLADCELRGRDALTVADKTAQAAHDVLLVINEREWTLAGMREQLLLLPPGHTVATIMTEAKTQVEAAEQLLDEMASDYEGQLADLRGRLVESMATIVVPPVAAVAPAASDEPQTVAEMTAHLRSIGLASSQLVVHIDCTKSNLTTGRRTFGGRSLHDVTDPTLLNPYQRVITIIGNVLAPFDEDGLVPVFGFGDRSCLDTSVFHFHGKPNSDFCVGLAGVLKAYTERIVKVTLAGPTSFAPSIKKTMELVTLTKKREFTFCLIIADGQVTAVRETEATIVEASKLPISICCVGVGDGPWEEMHRFDEELPQRKFDNFKFIAWSDIEKEALAAGRSIEEHFALAVLQEVPLQFGQCKRLRIL